LPEHDPGFPVAKYTLPSLESIVGEPHTPPPVHPEGTTLNV
jgi:hypothetical protein